MNFRPGNAWAGWLLWQRAHLLPSCSSSFACRPCGTATDVWMIDSYLMSPSWCSGPYLQLTRVCSLVSHQSQWSDAINLFRTDCAEPCHTHTHAEPSQVVPGNGQYPPGRNPPVGQNPRGFLPGGFCLAGIMPRILSARTRFANRCWLD